MLLNLKTGVQIRKLIVRNCLVKKSILGKVNKNDITEQEKYNFFALTYICFIPECRQSNALVVSLGKVYCTGSCQEYIYAS